MLGANLARACEDPEIPSGYLEKALGDPGDRGPGFLSAPNHAPIMGDIRPFGAWKGWLELQLCFLELV